ncbi:related to Isoflavone reductase homolog P3 [Fusarium torulosum]|uniref:Related to Isoflavone reductase homolog P3 n=1 Tax=Fusarium torulosum TaxID=33205 RepID=A0AAE8MEW5_9HYPO|nr:related to Isoflavone reductase homolog P3 [Fusarium torulosum]
MKVAIVGATGETGTSIVNGLLESTDPRYEITALVRHSSLQKSEVLDLEKRGINIVAADLDGPEDAMAKLLQGVDIVIAAVNVAGLSAQIPLANAAKAAGVKRFVPCFFATIAPPKGIMSLRDMKEDVLNHIKKIYLPYTVIDVGWWYQLTLPRLPSGRADYAHSGAPDTIVGDGNVLSALTDLRDVGKYVARIIADPQTLSRSVFAYSELWTQNQIYDLLERLSQENIKRNHVSVEAVKAGLEEAEAQGLGPESPGFYTLAQFQYWHSWGVRGDNTPAYAQYLGYQNAKELYGDMQGGSLEAYFQEVLSGKAKGVYEKLRAAFANSQQ